MTDINATPIAVAPIAATSPAPAPVVVPEPLREHADSVASDASGGMPDRKIIVSSATGIAVWLLGSFIPEIAHVVIPDQIVTLGAVLIGAVAGYLVPPSDTDLLRRAGDTLDLLKLTAKQQGKTAP